MRAAGRWTVTFDIVVQRIIAAAPLLVAVYCLTLVIVGAAGTTRTLLVQHEPLPRWSQPFKTGGFLAGIRIISVPLAIVFLSGKGPDILTQDSVVSLMWNTLGFSVAVIIPIGAAMLNLFVRYGSLEFVGTIMRPLMWPLFRLPGRSALDSITSWVGSYSVGLYLTRRLTLDGYYTKREAFTIVTCFSTVSIGFVAVVAQTLDLLHLFPLIFGSYFIAIYGLTAVLVRLRPIIGIPPLYVEHGRPEPERLGSSVALVREGVQRALDQAGTAPAPYRVLAHGLRDGAILASTILGTILVVGTAALLVARETALFDLLGRPLVPLLAVLGIPDPNLVAPATLVGITEMYIPALLVRDAAPAARFFVAVLSISQLIFFSAVGPMILDMFRFIPVRAWQLVLLFVMRTVLLIPVLALLTAGLRWSGVL
jgi:nucleoside recognition membrane protein YjiH